MPYDPLLRASLEEPIVNGSIVLCVVIRGGGGAFESVLHAMHLAYLPLGVNKSLIVISDLSNITCTQCTLYKSISSVRFKPSECFVLIEDSMDPSPFFAYWFWRACRNQSQSSILIVGNQTEPAAGVACTDHDVWKQFARGHRRDANGVTENFLHFARHMRLFTPPLLDGYAIIRGVRQSLAEPEREPKLTRVWNERFISESKIEFFNRGGK